MLPNNNNNNNNNTHTYLIAIPEAHIAGGVVSRQRGIDSRGHVPARVVPHEADEEIKLLLRHIGQDREQVFARQVLLQQ